MNVALIETRLFPFRPGRKYKGKVIEYKFYQVGDTIPRAKPGYLQLVSLETSPGTPLLFTIGTKLDVEYSLHDLAAPNLTDMYWRDVEQVLGGGPALVHEG